MVNSSFTHDMVWALSSVEPGIARPIERFDDLVGPWVQPLENKVDPIIKTARGLN